jgi:hypothetical protein
MIDRLRSKIVIAFDPIPQLSSEEGVNEGAQGSGGGQQQKKAEEHQDDNHGQKPSAAAAAEQVK